MVLGLMVFLQLHCFSDDLNYMELTYLCTYGYWFPLSSVDTFLTRRAKFEYIDLVALEVCSVNYIVCRMDNFHMIT